MVPGMKDLLEHIKILEDYVRACHEGEEPRLLPLTREEVDVIASFRRFREQEDD